MTSSPKQIMILFQEASKCNISTWSSLLYLSPDENTVLCVRKDGRFTKLPAGEGDSRVVNPVKQPLCLFIIQSNPKLISGCCKHGERKKMPFTQLPMKYHYCGALLYLVCVQLLIVIRRCLLAQKSVPFWQVVIL